MYINLVDGYIWDVEVARSSRVIPIYPKTWRQFVELISVYNTIIKNGT